MVRKAGSDKSAKRGRGGATFEWRAALDAIGEAICLTDLAGTILDCNRAYAELVGVDRASIAGRDCCALIHGLAEHSQDCPLVRMAATKSLEEEEVVVGGRWFRLVVAPLSNGAGEISGGVQILSDVTARKAAEEALRAGEERYRHVIDALPDPVFVKDDQHRWTILNDAFCKLMGYEREDLLGKSDFDFFPRDEAEVFWAKDDEVFASGADNVNEEYFTDAGGTRHVISTKKSVYRDSQTERQTLVGVIRDISEGKRVNEELHRHREHLEELVRERTAELAATNQRLLREAGEREQAEELRAAIYQISEAANQAENLEELFASIHSIVGRLMYARNFYIALYDPATNLLSFPYFVDAKDSKPAPFPLGKGMTSYVMRTGKPLLAQPGALDQLQARGEITRLGSDSIDWLGVPLKVQDRVIGVLAVQSYVGDVRYTQVDEDVLSYVSTQVADAIERRRARDLLAATNERLLREAGERERAEELRAAIYQISEAANQAENLERLFASIHAIVGRLMNAKNFYIALYDTTTNLLSFPYFVDEKDSTPEPFPLGRGMTSYVMRTGKPLLAQPGALDQLQARGEITRLGSDSVDWLGVPLKVQDRVIGVLAVQSYVGDVRYTKADEDVLSYVSTQVADAIERRRARDLLAATNERLLREAGERERAEELRAAIYEISESANQAENLEELFASIHKIVGRLMEAKNFYIALHDPATNLLSFPYFVDEVDTTPEPFPLGKGMTSHIIRSGQPLLATPEVFADLERQGVVETLGAPSIDWLGVPLVAGGRVIGALVVQTYAGGLRYGARDKEILTFVSHQIAQAIERKRAGEALARSESLLRAAFEHSAIEFWVRDASGRCLMQNSAALRHFGPQVGLRPEETEISAGDLAVWQANNRRALAGELVRGEVEYLVDGRKRHFYNSVGPFRVGDEIVGTTGMNIDITDQKVAETALRESEERYRMLIQRAPVGVFQYDANLRITDCNERFAAILENTRDGLVGLDMNQLNDRRVLPAIRAPLAGEHGEYDGPYRATMSPAEIYTSLRTAPLHREDGAIVGGMAIVEDMTEHRRLEEQLRQSQKMEVVGNLAGGVAHDFNNLLQAMLSHVQLLRSGSASPQRVHDVVRELEQQINRGASLTRQLLVFSRRETVKPERVRVNDAVREATQILQRLARANIALSIDLAPESLIVEADRGQLQQVLMNLTLNASDAMPEGGKLVIRTGAPSDREVLLSVEDSGHGIPDAIRDRIFEPFFTTKEPGKGTGLGLSVVHGIVTSCGGRIEVESRVGEGTTFRVILPRVGSGEHPAVAGERAEPPALAQGRGERILVVEDEDGAREGIRDILSSLGYRVDAVASGEAAVAIPTAEAADLLLTDLMLPGANGPDVAATLRGRWPGLSVILMSGYTEDEAVRRGVSAGNMRFLQKPFDIDALAAEVRAALDERPDPVG